MVPEQKSPQLSDDQLADLSELIYGFLKDKACFSDEILSSISVDIKFNAQTKSMEGLSTLKSADLSSAVVASLTCVPGVGRGCWPGFRLG